MTAPERPRRASDRWVTPRVVVAGLFLATVVILAVVAAVTYLTARGLNPDPMLRLAADAASGVLAAGTLILQLVGRPTAAKTERAAGQLAAGVAQVVEELDARPGRHALPLPPVPPPVVSDETRRHPFLGQRAAPGPVGR